MSSEITIRAAEADDPIIFVGADIEEYGFTPHAGLSEDLSTRVIELTENYRLILGQIAAMTKDSPHALADSPFRVDEITVTLGFDAKGKLGFILGGVEAGISATVSVKLARG